MGAEAAIPLELDRRDRAAAVGAGAMWAAAHDPKTVVAVLAADHVFEDGKQIARLFARKPTRRPIRAKSSPSPSRPTIPPPATTTFTPARRWRSIPMCAGSSNSWRTRRSARGRSLKMAVCGTRAISSSAPTSCWRSFSVSSQRSPGRLRRRCRLRKKYLGFIVLDACWAVSDCALDPALWRGLIPPGFESAPPAKIVGQVLGGDAVEAIEPLLEAAVIGVDVVDVQVRRLGGRLARRGHGVKGDFGFAGEGDDRLPASPTR